MNNDDELINSDVPVWEGRVVPAGNTGPAETVNSIYADGHWFWHSDTGGASSLVSTSTIRAAMAAANANRANYLLGVGIGSSGALNAAQTAALAAIP